MAFKTFQNGFPLPASDLNNFLMNQSVIVFASDSARTAAIPSPVEGMVTYLEDDNKLYVWTGAAWELVAEESPITTEGDLIIGDSSGDPTRIAIGAAGQVLISDGTTAVWDTAPGGGTDWTQLASGSITTGVNSFVLSSFTALDKYLLIASGITGNFPSVSVRVNSSNTNYVSAGLQISNSGGTFRHNDSTGIAAFGTNSTDQGTFSLILTGCQVANAKQFSMNGAGRGFAYASQGFWNNSATVSSLEIRSSANFTAGTYELWGSN